MAIGIGDGAGGAQAAAARPRPPLRNPQKHQHSHLGCRSLLALPWVQNVLPQSIVDATTVSDF